MRMKRFISGFIAVMLALVSLTLCVSAEAQEISVSVTVRAATLNTLIASAQKKTPDTRYDEFKWTGGTINAVKIWIQTDSGYIRGPKTEISKNAGFVKILYREEQTFQTGATAFMYAEQGNIGSQTLVGTAKFT